MSGAPGTLTDLDFYYLSTAKNIFLYGFLTVMTAGFLGNIFQILTFSRKTMRKISTGFLFLILSFSDSIQLILSIYVVVVYGFSLPDRSDLQHTCRLRHFLGQFTSNLSAWILTTSSFERKQNKTFA